MRLCLTPHTALAPSPPHCRQPTPLQPPLLRTSPHPPRGCHQWVNYFLHSGFLEIEGLKMSKSLKNFITIR